MAIQKPAWDAVGKITDLAEVGVFELGQECRYQEQMWMWHGTAPSCNEARVGLKGQGSESLHGLTKWPQL